MKKLLILFIFLNHVCMYSQDSAGAVLTVQNFQTLKNFIATCGKMHKVDLSGKLGGGMWVTYHTIEDGAWEVTVDHSKRIYFSLKKFGPPDHVGNILHDNNKVVTEFNYGMPVKDKKILEEEKRSRAILLNEFARLVNLARAEKK